MYYRWASGQELPSFDSEQNLENTEINIQDGRTTMSFRRALVTTDNNNEDLDLNQCVHLLRAWGDSVSDYNSPAFFFIMVVVTTVVYSQCSFVYKIV